MYAHNVVPVVACSPPSVWAIDSGCLQFICNNISFLTDIVIVNIVVCLGKKSTIRLNRGAVLLFGSYFYCLFAPSLQLNLISLPILDANNFSWLCIDQKVHVLKDKRIVGIAALNPNCGLYSFNALNPLYTETRPQLAFNCVNKKYSALVVTKGMQKKMWWKNTLVGACFLLRNWKNGLLLWNNE